MKKFLLPFFILFLSFQVSSQTLYARADNDWDVAGTWSSSGPGGASCGCIPTSSNIVIIDGYDVNIDAGTGSVTVSQLFLGSDARNDHALLRIQNGMRLTVTNNFTVMANRAAMSQTIEFVDNSSMIQIGGDLIIDQNTGDDIVFDIEYTGQLVVGDDFIVDKDGGDDLNIKINEDNGTAAGITVGGDFEINADNFNSDGIFFLLDDASSRIDVAGNFSISANTASAVAATVNFNLDDGEIEVDGTLYISRASNCGDVIFDMDGGDVEAEGLVINSSGTLFSATGVLFTVDADSRVFIDGSVTLNMTGGDDFRIGVNANNGTTASFSVAGNFDITRTSGDDLEFFVMQDNSVLSIGGNFSINTSGGEETEFNFDNDGRVVIGGNFSLTHSNGQQITFTSPGGGDNPLLSVGGGFSLNVTGGGDDVLMSFFGGTVAIGGNCVLTNGAGSNDFTLRLEDDLVFTVGGDMLVTHSGGDDFVFGMGETSAATATIDVAGSTTLVHNNNNASAAMYLRIFDTSEFETAGLTVTSTFAAAPQFSVEVANSSVLDVDGNLNLNAPASGELLLTFANSSQLQITGNIVRAAAPNRFGQIVFSTSSSILYNGTAQQVIAADAGDGTDNITYRSIILNNTFGTNPQFTMEGVATVNLSMNFTDGIVATTSANILVFVDNATVSNASAASFVDGPVRKVGNELFTFPVGDNTNHQALTISAPANVTDAFECQYFEQNPQSAYGTTCGAGLDHVSSAEHWILNRTTGASNVVVILSWDPASNVSNLADLKVARWNGTQWVDHGNGGTAGNAANGIILTSAAVTAFSPFTLASRTNTSNILPVSLVDFSAELINSEVRLSWTTAAEINSDYFEVERSSDAHEWQVVASVRGQGLSVTRTEYSANDEDPAEGVNYYRLKSVDLDGTFEYSNLVAVDLRMADLIVVAPNPASDVLKVSRPGLLPDRISITSAIGQQFALKITGTKDKLLLDVSTLPEGYYFLRVSGGAARSFPIVISR
jgi:hypothetical protein